MHAILLVISIFLNVLSCGLLRNDFCKREIVLLTKWCKRLEVVSRIL